MPELVSTRDQYAVETSYADAVVDGKPRDGGLYIPEGATLPSVSHDELIEWALYDYPELATAVKQKLTGREIPDEVQMGITEAAYSRVAFPSMKDGVLAPVEQVDDNLYIQNLSLGPTAAFKDIALRSLAQEMNYLLEQRGESMNILGATSGDTGSAAEDAFKGLPSVGIYMLSPETGMSDFQKAQMALLSGDNITNISVRDARFDDCQKMVKDPAFADFGAVNSINWGRIVAQIPYYFHGYLQAVGENIGEQVDFVVPTGNVGNVLSGHYAKSMGLPIGDLVLATNENSTMHRLTRTGEYIDEGAVVTSSPSMDIASASNYERLVYEMFQGDARRVTRYMGEFADKRSVSFEDHGLLKDTLRRMGIFSGTSSHADRLDSIAFVYDTSKKVIDPHTADGVTVALQRDRDKKTICLETALPLKFEPTINEALGFVPEREDERFVGLEARAPEDGFETIDNSVVALKKCLHDRGVYSGEM